MMKPKIKLKLLKEEKALANKALTDPTWTLTELYHVFRQLLIDKMTSPDKVKEFLTSESIPKLKEYIDSMKFIINNMGFQGVQELASSLDDFTNLLGMELNNTTQNNIVAVIKDINTKLKNAANNEKLKKENKMKITKEYLKQMILEEISEQIDSDDPYASHVDPATQARRQRMQASPDRAKYDFRPIAKEISRLTPYKDKLTSRQKKSLFDMIKNYIGQSPDLQTPEQISHISRKVKTQLGINLPDEITGADSYAVGLGVPDEKKPTRFKIKKAKPSSDDIGLKPSSDDIGLDAYMTGIEGK